MEYVVTAAWKGGGTYPSRWPTLKEALSKVEAVHHTSEQTGQPVIVTLVSINYHQPSVDMAIKSWDAARAANFTDPDKWATLRQIVSTLTIEEWQEYMKYISRR